MEYTYKEYMIMSCGTNRYVAINTRTGKRARFCVPPEARLNMSAPWDLLRAFEVFLLDALAGHENFKVFQSLWGYDDNEHAKREYLRCVRTKEKAAQVVENVSALASEVGDALKREDAPKRSRLALAAIADMKINANTNIEQMLSLCIAIAKIEYEALTKQVKI